MTPIHKVLERELGKMSSRGWDTIYVLVDIHETILKSTWKANVFPETWYRGAEEALRLMSEDRRIKLILWTSSKETDIIAYLKMFEEKGIWFDFVNSNSECLNTPYADYSMKPYFNVAIDDKCGFEPDKDWTALVDWFKENRWDKVDEGK